MFWPRAAVIEWEEWGNPAEKDYYDCERVPWGYVQAERKLAGCQSRHMPMRPPCC